MPDYAPSLPSEILDAIFRHCSIRDVIATFPLVCRAWNNVASFVLDNEGRLPIEVSLCLRSKKRRYKQEASKTGVHCPEINRFRDLSEPVLGTSNGSIVVAFANVYVFVDHATPDTCTPTHVENAVRDCISTPQQHSGEALDRHVAARGVRAVVTTADFRRYPHNYVNQPATPELFQLLAQFPIRTLSVTKLIASAWLEGNSAPCQLPSVEEVQLYNPVPVASTCNILPKVLAVCSNMSAIITEWDGSGTTQQASLYLSQPDSRIRKVTCYNTARFFNSVPLGWALENIVRHFPNLAEFGVVSFQDGGTYLSRVKTSGVYPQVRTLHVNVSVSNWFRWSFSDGEFARAVATHLPGIVHVHFTITSGGTSTVDEIASAWTDVGTALAATHLWFHLDWRSPLSDEGLVWREALKRVRGVLEPIGKHVHFLFWRGSGGRVRAIR